MIVYHGTSHANVPKLVYGGILDDYGTAHVAECFETAAIYGGRRTNANSAIEVGVFMIDLDDDDLECDSIHEQVPLGRGRSWRTSRPISHKEVVDVVMCDVAFTSISYAHYRWASPMNTLLRSYDFPILTHDRSYSREELHAYMREREAGPFSRHTIDAPKDTSEAWAESLRACKRHNG